MADTQYAFALTAQDLTGPAWQSFIQQARAAEQSVRNLQEPMQGMSDVLQGLRTRFDLVIGNEVLKKFIDFDKGIRDQIGSLKEQASALDLTTDQLQGYIAAFAKAGFSGDQARESYAKFKETLSQAAQGNQVAIQAFDQLGIKILDSSGKVRDQNVVLAEAARNLLGMGDSSQKTALSLQLFNQAGSSTAIALGGLTGGMDEAVRRAQELGTVSTPEVIAQFEKLKQTSNILELQIHTLYGSLAAPIETKALQNFSSFLGEVTAQIRAANGSWSEFLRLAGDASRSAGRIGSGSNALRLSTPQEERSDRIAELYRTLDQRQKELDTPLVTPGTGLALPGANERTTGRMPSTLRDEIARIKQEIAGLEATDRATAKGKEVADDTYRLYNDGLPAQDTTGAASNPKVASTGGGSGGSRDRIGENIKEAQAQAAAAFDGLNRLRALAAQPLPLEELEREALLEQKIADSVAAAGKYAKDDPRLPQLAQEIRLRETYKSQEDQIQASLKVADQTQRQYGDGQLQLLQSQYQINAALSTGRLTQNAATAAMVEYGRAAEDTRLKNIGLLGGANAFFAGWENAQNQFVRANSAFATGGKVFDGLMSTMDQALADFVNNGQVNFQKLITSFALMLLQMELRAAASSVWNWLSGAIGGAGGGATAGPAPVGGYQFTFAGSDGATPILSGARAGGGPVGGGGTYLVGEDGPELFTPQSSGSITPNSALRGEVQVTVVNNTGVQATATKRETKLPGGGKSIEIVMAEAVEARIANNVARGTGPMASVMSGKFGRGAPRQ